MPISPRERELLKQTADRLKNHRRIAGKAIRLFEEKLREPGDSATALRRDAGELVKSIWPMIAELNKLDKTLAWASQTEVTSEGERK